MDKNQYEFLTTIYDKEELRIATSLLSEGNIRFKINNKSNPISGRAPLSTYFEVDILIYVSDYARALELIQKIEK